jgi:hypothetical protein
VRQRPRKASISYLAWCAIGFILPTLTGSLLAQSPSVESIESPATGGAAAPTIAASAPALPVFSRLGPGSDAIAGSNVPAYKLLRYDEDYSYLAAPARRSDFWDPLKYVPFSDHEGWYTSFGIQFRERFEYYNNANFGAIPGGNGYLLQRYLLHGDFHFGPNIRFFGQFMSGFENGRIGGPRPEIDEDIFDGHQAFLDIVQHLGDDEDKTLTWRIGRQEMSYGSERLVSVREGVNLRRSFDAARVLFRGAGWSVDGFWSKPVLNRRDVFDDIPDPKISLWGVYAIHPFELLPKGHADLYYLGYENKEGIFEQGAGYELRNSLGTRLWGQPMPWEYNVEALWQFGRFRQGAIEAWAVASAFRYNFEDSPLHPRLGLIADVASGDQNPRSGNLQTYNPMFPTGAYLNLANPIGPANFIQVHPTADVRLFDKATLKADWAFVWRQSLEDGVYGPFVGVPIRTGLLSRKRFIGSAPAVTLTWNATRHLTLLASYVHFFAGPFLKETPPGKDMDYATLWLDYTF